MKNRKKISFNNELLIQKHIKLGYVDTKNVVLINVSLAILIFIGSSLGIVWILPNSFEWIGILWCIWGIVGSLVSEKMKLKNDYVVSFPAYVCTYTAAYIIGGVYWLVYKIFIKL